MAGKRFPQIVHTWMYGDMEFERVAACLGEIGADGADLGMTFSGAKNSPRAWDAVDVKTILERQRLRALCVTPLCNAPELDLSNPDPAMRRIASDFVAAGIALAARAGCDRVMVTPSWFSVKHVAHGSYEDDFKRGADELAKLAEQAALHGVTLLIEPINRFRVALIHTVDDAKRMIAAIGMPNLGIAADTYHMNMEEDRSVASAILKTGTMLGCLHIGENNRKPPGFGSLDWKSILLALCALGFSGPLSHEPVFYGFDERKVAGDAEYRRWFQEMMAHGIGVLRMAMETL